MEFREISINDKEWLTQKFREDDKRSCEFCFANNYLWRKVYPLEITEVCGCAVERYIIYDDIYYAFPIGLGDKKRAIEKIMLYEQVKKNRVNISGMTEKEAELINIWFPKYFIVEADRDASDYIYETEALSNLTGKKYHGKRNHIARFKDGDDWLYEKITEENVEECIQMNYLWKRKRTDKWDDMMQEEYDVAKEALANFKNLGLVGGLLRKAGNVVAFTLGEPLNSDTFVVHFEKAFPDVQGAYPMINMQFVLAECQGYKYINREEDAGDEGLRKAKMSYHPVFLQEKYTARQKS